MTSLSPVWLVCPGFCPCTVHMDELSPRLIGKVNTRDGFRKMSPSRSEIFCISQLPRFKMLVDSAHYVAPLLDFNPQKHCATKWHPSYLSHLNSIPTSFSLDVQMTERRYALLASCRGTFMPLLGLSCIIPFQYRHRHHHPTTSPSS